MNLEKQIYTKAWWNKINISRKDILRWISYINHHGIDKNKINRFKTPIKFMIKSVLMLSKKYEIDINNEDWVEKMLFSLIEKDDIYAQNLWYKINYKIQEEDFNPLNKSENNSYLKAINDNFILQEVNTDWIVIYVNRVFEEISWFSRYDVIWKKVSIMWWKKKHTNAFWSDLWNTVLSWEKWEGTIINRKKSWEYYWVDTKITPVKNKHWEVYKFIVIRYDVSDLHRSKINLEEMSFTDWLTWLYNRRKFDLIFFDMVKQFEKENKQFCTAIMDIDNFSSFNNNYWHQVGDDVLRQVWDILKNNINGNNKSFRYWWEEFILLLDMSNLDQAYKTIEKIRKTIQNSIVSINWKKLNITASFWLSKYSWWNSFDFLKEVDDLLYKSKSDWKNKITSEKNLHVTT